MRRESALLINYYEMSEITGKRKKKYVDHLKDRYKLTCLDHPPGYSSDEYKVLGDFGTEYSKIRPTKDCRQEPANRKEFIKKEDNSDIFQVVVYEIIIYYSKKISVKDKLQENINSKVNKNYP